MCTYADLTLVASYSKLLACEISPLFTEASRVLISNSYHATS